MALARVVSEIFQSEVTQDQWPLSLSPNGATEPWSIFGENEKKHYNKNTLKAHIECHNTKVQP